MRKPPLYRDTLDQARHLRRGSTDAERLLWRHLRDRRLSGAKFRRQCSFGPYVADFYCDAAKLVIELDGGGHAQTQQAEHDEARHRELKRRGIRQLRFWNNEVLQNLDGVLQVICEALSPSPHGRGRG
jgi:very-short-patch-repair endonuclease